MNAASSPRTLILLALLLGGCSIDRPPAVPQPDVPGNYRTAEGDVIGVDRFITDQGEATLLLSDYESRIVRRLYPTSDDTYEMGPDFAQQFPVQLQLHVRRDHDGDVTALQLQPTGSAAALASRISLRHTEVRIPNGDRGLSGTLIEPTTPGPHPAIVLLHGSGPLTRYSFGPYPHFFSSLGFAVLVYDKRGTGDSQGELFDSSTGILPALPAERFPDRLVSDAQAAVRYLRARPGIDAEQIGLWGSSEGGIITAQVAAADSRIAFIVDSSGAVAPLWETRLYQAGLSLRGRGFSEEQVQQVKAATRQWLHTAQTGEGFEEMMAVRKKALDEGNGWLVGWTPLTADTLEEVRWHWEHVASYDPREFFARVRCPVLALFGELDTSTDAAGSVRQLRATLEKAGHRDFTVKLIAGAGHSLMENAGGGRMASGVFDALAPWLKERVRFPDAPARHE